MKLMANKKINLSIVIVNYKTKDLLFRCLTSIFKSQLKDIEIEVIVVDNASEDETVLLLKNNFKQVHLIENKENFGFARANNQAIRIAKGNYILLLNPDTEIFPDTLSIMFKFMEEHPDVGVSTCYVKLKRNGLLDDACHRGFPTPWNAFCHFSGISKLFPRSRLLNGYHLGYCNLDRVHEIDSCVGAFMLIRNEVGSAVGWLDEDYYWYGEDLDFCYKVKQRGWKTMFVPDTKIIHWKGASSGIRNESQPISTASKETKIKSALASTQAMRIFYQKHYLKKYPKILTSLVLLMITLLEKKRIAKIQAESII